MLVYFDIVCNATAESDKSVSLEILLNTEILFNLNQLGMRQGLYIKSNLAQSQILFYMHRRHIVSDHGTQYDENPSNHHGGMCKDGLMD